MNYFHVTTILRYPLAEIHGHAIEFRYYLRKILRVKCDKKTCGFCVSAGIKVGSI